MTGAAWGGLIVAWIAAIALPGPDVFLLLRLGVRERRAAVLASLGIMTGNLVWILVTVLGLTALFAALPALLPIMQVLGALILTYLGAQSIRAGLAQLRDKRDIETAGRVARPWLLGLTTNLANPKALIFFTALLSQFLPPGAGWEDRAAIVLVMVGTGIAWFTGVAIASSGSAFRRWFGRAAPWFDVVAGALFVLVALGILAEVAISLATP